MSNELTKKAPGTLVQLKGLLEEQRDKLALWAGSDKKAKQIIDRALMAIQNNADLLKCKPATLFQSLREAVSNGLDIGGLRPLAYLIPFGERVTLIPSYIGLTELVRRTGNLLRHTLEVVYEGDEFSFQLGDDPFIKHKPMDSPNREKNKPTHVYSIWWMKDGAIHRSVWTAARVNAHKERYSKGWRKPDSPWQTAWDAMAKKTLVRDLVNRGILAIQTQNEEASAGPLLTRDEPVSEVITQPATAIEHKLEQLNVEVLDCKPEDDLWVRYECAIEEAANLGTLTAVRDEFLPLFKNDDDRDVAAHLADKAADRLRQEKSAKANA